MRLKLQEQNELKFVSRIVPCAKHRGISPKHSAVGFETQASETKCEVHTKTVTGITAENRIVQLKNWPIRHTPSLRINTMCHVWHKYFLDIQDFPPYSSTVKEFLINLSIGIQDISEVAFRKCPFFKGGNY